MRKVLLHIFLLGLLLQTGLANAIVLPHAAIKAAALQSEGQTSRYGGTNDDTNSHISKDVLINDWDDFDESEHEEHAASSNVKGDYTTLSAAKEKMVSGQHSCLTVTGKTYPDFNFSRLPRHNYISLQVFRL